MYVTLPDGKRLDLPEHATARNFAEAIGPGLAKAALGATANGQLTDLLTELPDGAEVSILTKKDDAVLRLMRHTLAHVMAQAVADVFTAEGFPREAVNMGIGPVIENGFYYDFDLPRSLGATGSQARIDNSDIDRLLEQGDAESAETDAAPVRASRAISTHTSTRSVVLAASQPASSKVPLILGIGGGILGAGIIGVVIAGFATGILGG